MNRLLLVDGSNLLFQMFFGMPARIVNEDGKAIQGTLGFVGALLKIIRMTCPTHVAVLFDGEHENDRKKLDAEYKADRPDYSGMPEEETPFSQLPDIYAALDLLRIPHSETENCETDDWIAGYARRYGGDWEIVIASMDSDFFQLITDRVRVLRYRGVGSVLCDRAYLREKLGVEAEQYPAFKSLTGDAADNIPGVPKIGSKTAAGLLRQFGTLEGLLANAEQIAKPSIRAAIEENRERLLINYRLIRLIGTETLPFTAEEMKWSDEGLTTMQVLRGTGLRRDGKNKE